MHINRDSVSGPSLDKPGTSNIPGHNLCCPGVDEQTGGARSSREDYRPTNHAEDGHGSGLDSPVSLLVGQSIHADLT